MRLNLRPGWGDSRCRSEAEALGVAYTVAESPLVKTAVHGGDPNWGRVLGALGVEYLTMHAHGGVAQLIAGARVERGIVRHLLFARKKRGPDVAELEQTAKMRANGRREALCRI